MKFGMQKVGDDEYRIEKTARPGMRVPVTIYANETLIAKMETDRTIDQAVNVAHLPGIEKHTVVLPDGHEGYGFPIGGVAATNFNDGVISPGGVGYDINCGVRLLRTNLSQAAARQKLSVLVKEMFRAVPSGLGNTGALNLSIQQLDSVLAEGVKWAVSNGYGRAEDLEFCEENGTMKHCDPSKVSGEAKKRGSKSLGTLGSGNHFLEVELINKVLDREAAERFGISEEDKVCVLMHRKQRSWSSGLQRLSENN